MVFIFFLLWATYNADKYLLNGFSALDCITQRITNRLFSWAEPPAHILLHALMLSPILRAWHRNFRKPGLTLWQFARGVRFLHPYPSQLKD
ncbi:hypothetical protein [Klebsiella indica]|uniref:protein YnhH n=1 Tax=Klebsiella indica TaxID=2582917 RepID=UPI003BAA18E6